MASGKRSSAGERVLEGRHVIGLFFLMLLFSGVFFTLGYVMGKNQLEGQVRAATTHDSAPTAAKPDPSARHGKSNVSTPGPSDSGNSASDANPTTATPDWEFYRAGEKTPANDHLKPALAPPNAASSQPKAIVTSAKSPVPVAAKSVSSTNPAARSAFYLQVAALRSENDAVALANDLHKKKFVAFVQSPQGDKYYRVQVGPYPDQKSAESAKKGLEAAGFKAIIKH